MADDEKYTYDDDDDAYNSYDEDDDAIDLDEEDEDDDLDDDDEEVGSRRTSADPFNRINRTSPSSTANPFAGRPVGGTPLGNAPKPLGGGVIGGQRASDAPTPGSQTARPGTPAAPSGGGSLFGASNRPGAPTSGGSTSGGGSQPGGNRPGAPTSGGGGSGGGSQSSGNRPGAPTSGGSSGGGSKSSGNRPGAPTSGGSSGGGSPFGGSRPGTPASGGSTSGGGAPFGGSRPGTPASGGSSGGGAPFGGNRPGTPASGGSSSGGGAPFGGNRPSTPASGGSSSGGGAPFGGNRPSTPTPTNEAARPLGDKPKPADAKPAGGGNMLSGLAGRLPFGGGAKPADAADKPKPADAKPAGGGNMLGGLAGRLPFGGGAKPADANKPKADADKPGGLAGRLPFGGGAKPADANKSAGSGNPIAALGDVRNQFGDRLRPGAASAAKGEATKVAPAQGRAAASSAQGSRARDAKAAPSLQERVAATRTAIANSPKAAWGGVLKMFGRTAPAGGRPARPARSRPVQVESEGLSLDRKLDIVGGALVLVALLMLLNNLSTTRGALTDWFYNLFAGLLGWGAWGVPIVAFVVGVWLLIRHFGDEPPVVQPLRVIGVGMTYAGALLLFQWVDTFSYPAIGTLEDLRAALDASVAVGSGGGWAGANLYFVLVSYVGDAGSFAVMTFLLLAGLMLAADLSVSDVALFTTATWRNLRDSGRRYAERRAAYQAVRDMERRRLAAAVAVEAPKVKPGISMARPAPDVLPPGLPQLPTSAEAARNIPISMGGRTVSTNMSGADAPATTADGGAARTGLGRLGGLFNRPGQATPVAPTQGAPLPQAPAAQVTAPLAPPPVPSGPVGPFGVPLSEAAPSAPQPPPPTVPLPGQVAAERTSRLDQLRQRAAQQAMPQPPQAAPSFAPAAPLPTAPQAPAAAYPSDAARPMPLPSAPRPQTPTPPPGFASAPPAGGFAAPPVRASVQASSPPLRYVRRNWALPEYRELLNPGSEQDFDQRALVAQANVIEETLRSFGAPGRVVEINTGPVITQFGIEPDYLTSRSGKRSRVKVSAIAQLDRDLQLALGAKSIRIEAPVPGKGYVGVEIPNTQTALVSLRDVMDSEQFKRIASPMAIALGQSVDGTPVAGDLASMPHLLIAGTTGSGKSVCVNAIICSLLIRNTPDRLKLIMVDPKRVELTGYNGIPHLVSDVVVELERIVGVLKWVTREMDERYKRFSTAQARNIEDFNKHIGPDDAPMPYIVVIIDELADLMMLAPEETEKTITRIAALARATGIHLVIATQRPSVDVVTGLIKANFPARIAFAVAGGVDSRVILDQPGAERLLGRGDMLYLSGDTPAPLRLQGVFVGDGEIDNIVRFWKSAAPEGPATVPGMTPLALDASPPPRMTPQGLGLDGNLLGAPSSGTPRASGNQNAFWDDMRRDADDDDMDDDDEYGDDDDMYDEAVALVRKQKKASVSLLQRRLRIGYTRASRLIDLMEERGVVGPQESGSKPREVMD